MSKSGMAGGLNDAFGDPDKDRSTQTLARLAHTALPVVVVTLGIRAAEWFIAVPLWLDIIASVILTLAFLAASFHQNLARICVRCMERVPADAPVRAQRQRWALWVEHFIGRRIVIWLALWIGIILFVGIGRHVLYPGIASGDPRDNWLLAPNDVFFAVYVYAMVMHHRLSPWCPYCKWGDGGDHEPSPTPTPDPSGVKSA